MLMQSKSMLRETPRRRSNSITPGEGVIRAKEEAAVVEVVVEAIQTDVEAGVPGGEVAITTVATNTMTNPVVTIIPETIITIEEEAAEVAVVVVVGTFMITMVQAVKLIM